MRSRKITIWVMVMVLMVFCLSLLEAQAAIVFSDGGTHIIGGDLGRDDVEVRDSPLGEPTTFNLVTGGWVRGIFNVRDSSQINMSGGEIMYDLCAYENSQANISGGSIGGYLWAWDNSQVNFSGGEIIYDLCAYSDRQLNISGGSIGRGLITGDIGLVNITGGSIGSDSWAYALWAYNNSQVNISGGSIGGYLWTWDSSQVSITGGSIGDLYVRSNSQITIDGSGFNYPYGTITGDGRLTGTLASGDPIDSYFSTDPYAYARILLVPEPATLLLLGFGVPIISGLRRKR